MNPEVGGVRPEQDGAGEEDLISLLSGLTSAILGSGHQGVVVSHSVCDDSEA